MSHHYVELKNADLRLVILRLLAEDPGFATNESILQSILPGFGHTVARDKIRTELRWLEEQGLVTVQEVTTVLVAKLTGRGVDVANGAARVDGVKRPSPR